MVVFFLNVLFVAGELEGYFESQAGSIFPILMDHSGDNVKCVLTPQVSGPHALYLNFTGLPLPGSPYPVIVESGAAGVRVTLSGSGLTTATCGQQADFTIDGSQAGPGMYIVVITHYILLLFFYFSIYFFTIGNPVVTLAGSRHEISVNIEKKGDNIYNAFYTPVSPGPYLLNVLWGHRYVIILSFKYLI